MQSHGKNLQQTVKSAGLVVHCIDVVRPGPLSDSACPLSDNLAFAMFQSENRVCAANNITPDVSVAEETRQEFIKTYLVATCLGGLTQCAPQLNGLPVWPRDRIPG